MAPRPKIETLATGDEIVGGDVLDSNAAELSRQLGLEGHAVSRFNAVPDDRALIAAAIREIAARADLCVCSGGLGPTIDDFTAEVAAEVAGVPLVLDEKSLETMRARFAKIGLRFSENNARSARIPRGADVYQNGAGSAPAFSLVIGRCRFYFVPGPPKEYAYFLEREILPWVRGSLGGGPRAVIQLKTLGWPESHLAERFDDYSRLFPGVKVGYRARNPEVWLKLTAEAESREKALEAIRPAVEEAERRLGPSVYGRDEEELPGVLHRLLLERRPVKLATAESCTGGMIGQLLTSNAGSSEYYVGGIVAYANFLKTSLLGVPDALLTAHGAVSRECAEAMAQGARDRFESDLAVSVTGIAGPGGATPNKPVGLVYLAVASPDGVTALERRFRGDRERVQRAAALTALEMVRRRLLGLPVLEDGVG